MKNGFVYRVTNPFRAFKDHVSLALVATDSTECVAERWDGSIGVLAKASEEGSGAGPEII